MTNMGRITYNPETRSFSGQTAIGKVAGVTADAVESAAESVGDAVADVGKGAVKSVKKGKRSLGELLKDTFIDPKTKADRLRRRSAIAALMSTASLAISAKAHVDKNNMRKYDADVHAWHNALYDYQKGRRKDLPKPPDIPSGIDATIDYWKKFYNDGKSKVESWFASASDTEDEDMASLSEEYRNASKEESGRMKKALNDMANRCRAKSVGF